MDTHQLSFRSTLLDLRKSLPKGSVFAFDLSEDRLFLKLIRVPSPGKGVGTRFLAEVLAAADAAGYPVRLVADPTDTPGDPDTVALVRWYSRFGFEPHRATDDGVWMDRPVPATPGPATEVLRSSEAARATRPTLACVETWLEQARLKEGASPAWRRQVPRP